MQDRSVKPSRRTAVLATALPTHQRVGAYAGILVALAFITAPEAFAHQAEVSSSDGDGARFATSLSSTLEATDENPAGLTTKLTIDGELVSPGVTTLLDGGHALTAIARDAAGNETRIDRVFFIPGLTLDRVWLTWLTEDDEYLLAAATKEETTGQRAHRNPCRT